MPPSERPSSSSASSSGAGRRRRRRSLWRILGAVASSLRRKLIFVGYHHVFMLVLVTSITLLSVLLAGCTTERLSSVYILSLSYTNASTATQDPVQMNANLSASTLALARDAGDLEIRIGYFGFCLVGGGPAICSGDLGVLAGIVRDAGRPDPLNLLWAAKQFHDGTIFSGLIFIALVLAFVSFLLLSTFPGWHESDDDDDDDDRSEVPRVKPFPSRPVLAAALGCSVAAALFALMSAFWQHLAAGATVAMVEAFGYGTASGRAGAAAMALGWVGMFLLAVSALGLWLMARTIAILVALVE